MRPVLICALFLQASWLMAADPFRFDITDARGKKPGGVNVEWGEPDAAGWYALKLVVKGKGRPVLLWPFDGRARAVDGPGDIPVIVIEAGDKRALTNIRILGALRASELLGVSHASGLEAGDLSKTTSILTTAEEPFARGVGLLYAKQPIEAAPFLARALRERERQLTRVPSEIYPAAILSGRALLEAGKFDDAAVAFLKALKLRPNDPVASRFREEALAKAGKAGAQ